MPIIQPIQALIFDWGDTIMQDFGHPGPMSRWPEVAWIPGAEASLKKLSKHYPCVIATSADHSGTEEMIAALKRVGADRYFRHFFASNDLGYKKPDPRFFEAITNQLSLEPQACVMIGNHYEKDIVGAKKAGMQTVLFDPQKQQTQFPLADAIIHDMHNLKGIIPF
jgi:HAD superfamily hydrolase (TIGR01509 family)